MIARYALILTLLTSLRGAWAAEAPASTDVARYLEDLQVKIEHSAQRANQPTSSGTSVIALRGSKQIPISKQLYWKGKDGGAVLSPDEIKPFRQAIAEAREGKTETAVASLKAFIDHYPKSPLIPDAQETLRLLTPPQPPVNQVK